jgi:16S rRNA (adenine1518-N6/adenine1519-N6)-dimethyltransferase
MTVRPKLGQHFLADERYRRRILEALQLRRADLVIEVGPGRGAMTHLLTLRAARLVAVEIDCQLVERLRREVPQDTAVEVIHGDILATDIARLCQNRGFASCFVFGNLPYYITSPILHRLFSFRSVISGMALMVQIEVALRLTASPGTRDYGYLSVLAQMYSRPRIAIRVPAGAFAPPPQVDSALVTFEMARTALAASPAAASGPASGPSADAESGFLEFVKTCFGRKRKSVLNNLSRHYPRTQLEKTLQSMALEPHTRAEQMSIEQLFQLYRLLSRPK